MISKNRLFLGAALLSLMVLSGMTVALAHGGDAALIHACVNNSSGTIKIVGPNDTCRNNWSPLDWNIQGIQGEPGPQGDPGPQGPEGPQGPAGPDGTNYPKVGFFVGKSGDRQCISGLGKILEFDQGPFHFNDGGGWNDGIDFFTLPEAGVYQFNAVMNFHSGEVGDDLAVYLTNNGTNVIQSSVVIFEDARETITLSITYKGAAGDQVGVAASSINGSSCLEKGSSTFSGALVYPTP